MCSELCRTCLSFTSKLHDIRNTKVQETFEKLTGRKITTSRDASVCYICYAHLQRIRKFADLAWKSEVVFNQLIDKGVKITQEVVTKIYKAPSYLITPVDYFYSGLKKAKTSSEVKKEHGVATNIQNHRPNIQTEENRIQIPAKNDVTSQIIKKEPLEDQNESVEQEGLKQFQILHNDNETVQEIETYYNNETEVIVKIEPKDEIDEKWREDYVEGDNYHMIKSEDLFEEEQVEIEYTEYIVDGKEVEYENSLQIQSHTCSICDRTFQFQNQLQNHVAAHEKNKIQSCPLCNKGYEQKYLKNHIKMHIKEKSHNCQYCGYLFIDYYSLKRHMKIHNKNKPSVKTYNCNICNKNFFHRNHLETHVRTHTELKPFSCDVCNQTFSQKCSLIDHKRIHTSEKTHYCSECNKGFYRIGQLHQHMVVHTKNSRFKCIYCSKRFTTKIDLVQHPCKLR